MPKFFVDNSQIENNIISIINDDVNHIKNVLRSKINEQIEISVKNDKTYLCKIIDVQKDCIKCKILHEITGTTEPNTYIHLLQALPKFDKMELVIQKTTEIGVKEITPIITKRCITKLDEKSQQNKISRWKKIAEVAAKQSGRDFVPIINNCTSLKDTSKIVQDYDIILVAYENEKEKTLKNELKQIQKSNSRIAIIIGPEGGLEQEEVEFLQTIDAKSITLGSRILRTETAGLVICSNILYELEE